MFCVLRTRCSPSKTSGTLKAFNVDPLVRMCSVPSSIGSALQPTTPPRISRTDFKKQRNLEGKLVYDKLSSPTMKFGVLNFVGTLLSIIGVYHAKRIYWDGQSVGSVWQIFASEEPEREPSTGN